MDKRADRHQHGWGARRDRSTNGSGSRRGDAGLLHCNVGLFDRGRAQTRQPRRIRRGLAGAWPPLFAVAVANAVFLVIGSVTLVYTIDSERRVRSPDMWVMIAT